ncbi:hypothetical protein [Mycobacterium stomatepiae]|nr:hypothetical protein [Mycobacterium stomatepiae]
MSPEDNVLLAPVVLPAIITAVDALTPRAQINTLERAAPVQPST